MKTHFNGILINDSVKLLKLIPLRDQVNNPAPRIKKKIGWRYFKNNFID
tara:strand:- start:492 stop:638 length:147 start_codon:yes stop_codon:yes gene_type:complete